ncbi:hypothetical protein [Sphingomonas paeninsulae]|uniref:hypothetical protein n=1 Tax=Sphingomonas paeninsulae TaxID=2319844 RepID=UPI0013CEB276|nr:hypothetical protein [Sphingomonas paeninsulae]
MLYLAVVNDRFNQHILGFAMWPMMTWTLIMDAARLALSGRHHAPGLTPFGLW